ncbi:MAG: hypothetical protein J6L81_07445 [Clostridia bacterium]|nr:hypothetical protein [Clostridia bacterium]
MDRKFKVEVSPVVFADESRSNLQYRVNIVTCNEGWVNTNRTDELEAAISNIIMLSLDWIEQFDGQSVKVWYDPNTDKSIVGFSVTAINAEDAPDCVYEQMREEIYDAVVSWCELNIVQ